MVAILNNYLIDQSYSGDKIIEVANLSNQAVSVYNVIESYLNPTAETIEVVEEQKDVSE